MIFSFGHAEMERVEIDVLSYERSPTGEYYDDNWLNVDICVKAGGFRGKVSAAIITEDLVQFASQLRPLYDSLSGSAKFSTMEEQLSLNLVGDGKGHIELRGEVADRPGLGNRLHLSLQFDQSQLGESIRELERVISEFPVRIAKPLNPTSARQPKT
jgi:hypothetical protein